MDKTPIRTERIVSISSIKRVIALHSSFAARQARLASNAANEAVEKAVQSFRCDEVWTLMLRYWHSYVRQCGNHLVWCVKLGVPMRRRSYLWRVFMNTDRVCGIHSLNQVTHSLTESTQTGTLSPARTVRGAHETR